MCATLTSALAAISLSPTGHTVRLFGQKRVNGRKLGGAPLNLPKIRKNPLVEIIPINTGSVGLDHMLT